MQGICHDDPDLGGVCKESPTAKCSCRGGNIHSLQPDPYDYKSFIDCKRDVVFNEINMTKMNRECGPNQEFSTERQKCVPMPFFEPCKDVGSQANYRNCRWYSICTFPAFSYEESYHQIFARCANPLHSYSRSEQACVDPSAIPFGATCSKRLPTPPSQSIPQYHPIMVVDNLPPNVPITDLQIPSVAYTCPFIVVLFIFWFPGIVNYLCWVS